MASAFPEGSSAAKVARVCRFVFVAFAAAGCSSTDSGECSGAYHCPNIGSGTTLSIKLDRAESITTEAPCQVTLTHEVPRFFSASLPAGTTMAMCPLHVHFSNEPDLDSTITITFIEIRCCGSGWSFWSPLFEEPVVPPDASRDEASDAADVSIE
jgi:hypothetical protein